MTDKFIVEPVYIESSDISTTSRYHLASLGGINYDYSVVFLIPSPAEYHHSEATLAESTYLNSYLNRFRRTREVIETWLSSNDISFYADNEILLGGGITDVLEIYLKEKNDFIKVKLLFPKFIEIPE